jgi:hypothetical protein
VEKKIACGKKRQKDNSPAFPQAIFLSICGNVENFLLSIATKCNTQTLCLIGCGKLPLNFLLHKP